jgi:alpha-tubulin suppressor-like RCC1 family protein
MRGWRLLLTVAMASSCGRYSFERGSTDTVDDAGDAGDDGPIDGIDAAVCSASRIVAGWDNTCAVRAGEVWCWGQNTTDQLGPNAGSGIGPVVIPLATADDVTIGNDTLCAHLPTNEIWCWGQGVYGQIGDGSLTNPQPNPQKVTNLPGGLPALAVASGGDHHCAILSDATVACWGSNDFDQLGTAAMLPNCSGQRCSTMPLLVAGLSNVSQIVTGIDHSCALSGGTVLCWGQNNYGQLGDTTTTLRATPQAITGVSEPIAQLSAGDNHNCAVAVSGNLYCWGRNNATQLGVATTEQCSTLGDCSTTALAVAWPAAVAPSRVAAGGAHSCAVDGDGRVWCWGQNDNGQVGIPAATPDVTMPTDTQVISVADVTSGNTHSCVRTSDGEMACWGENSLGQLANGAGPANAAPAPVVGVCP